MQNRKFKYSQFLLNKNYNFSRDYVLKYLPSKLLIDAYKSISKWKGYRPTPLLNLNKLNNDLKLNNIFYKDSELEPEDSLMFKVTLIPFGNLDSPQLY